MIRVGSESAWGYNTNESAALSQGGVTQDTDADK